LNAFLNSFLDFLLPRFCFECSDKLLPGEYLFCAECLPEIPRVPPDRLAIEFERKFLGEEIISGFTSLFLFEKDGSIQKVIHEMKYQNSFNIGKTLGRIAGEELFEKAAEWNADMIIPVPIHSLRRADRGYNQSLYIAKGIGEMLFLPVKSGIVKRGKYTATQTTLNLNERKENVADAFTVKKNTPVKGKRIILIDDVITTGATITECAKALLNAGAVKVFAISVALAE